MPTGVSYKRAAGVGASAALLFSALTLSGSTRQNHPALEHGAEIDIGITISLFKFEP
jgi:hypothetical protein